MLYEIILMYLLFLLIIFNICNIRDNKWEKLIFSIFVPVFGLLIVIISEKTKSINESVDHKINSQKSNRNKTSFTETEMQSSLIDNLLLEDYDQAREILLSIKKFELKEQCAIYKIAIKSKNVEIAHIAAISLMEIKNHFEKEFRDIEKEKNNNQIPILKKHIKLLNQYLECNLVTGALKSKYNEELINLIGKLRELDPTCKISYLKILISKYIELGDYEKALKCIEKTKKLYGLNEEIYEELLKLYIKKNDFKSFANTLVNIKTTSDNNKKFEHFLEFWEKA